SEEPQQPAQTLVNPPELAAPRGFNHGIVVTGGRLLFLAGQDASDAEGRIVATGDLVGQFEQVMRNLSAVVRAAGGQPHDIVKLNLFVADRADYIAQRQPIGVIYRQYFGTHYPAMALFQVTGFYQPDALI